MGAILEERKLVYPESDGKPMGETWYHVRAMLELHPVLEDFFRDRPDVFIATDMFWYFEEGVTKSTAPDLMVIPGVGNHPRRSFFTWKEEGAVPAVIFEMASKGTWREDFGEKFDLYEARGVREYFIFDPEAKYIRPRLQGFRLGPKGYRRIKAVAGSLPCELGFGVRPEGSMLRLIDPTTGQPIPTRSEKADEESRRAEDEKRRAEDEKRRADTLEAEVARLTALLKSQSTGSTP